MALKETQKEREQKKKKKRVLQVPLEILRSTAIVNHFFSHYGNLTVHYVERRCVHPGAVNNNSIHW